LLDGDRILAETCQPARSHSQTLLPIITDLLAEAGLEREQLEGLAVGIGPGSFTGVRIGLTMAKALAYAGGLGLVGVSSLQALAENGRGLAPVVCPAIDALKDEVYSACYRFDASGLTELEPPAARAPQPWAAALAAAHERLVVLGSGFERYQSIFEGALGEHLLVPDAPIAHRMSAGALGRLARPRLEQGPHDDPRVLEPSYCRLPEAELARKKRQS
jgi:tRNA threonylcarbamoyladenosine biosynthesis protein TsaB